MVVLGREGGVLIMDFLPEFCESSDVNSKGELVACGSKATKVLEPELMSLCEKHYKEWMKFRKGE